MKDNSTFRIDFGWVENSKLSYLVGNAVGDAYPLLSLLGERLDGLLQSSALQVVQLVVVLQHERIVLRLLDGLVQVLLIQVGLLLDHLVVLLGLRQLAGQVLNGGLELEQLVGELLVERALSDDLLVQALDLAWHARKQVGVAFAQLGEYLAALLALHSHLANDLVEDDVVNVLLFLDDLEQIVELSGALEVELVGADALEHGVHGVAELEDLVATGRLERRKRGQVKRVIVSQRRVLALLDVDGHHALALHYLVLVGYEAVLELQCPIGHRALTRQAEVDLLLGLGGRGSLLCLRSLVFVYGAVVEEGDVAAGAARAYGLLGEELELVALRFEVPRVVRLADYARHDGSQLERRVLLARRTDVLALLFGLLQRQYEVVRHAFVELGGVLLRLRLLIVHIADVRHDAVLLLLFVYLFGEMLVELD